MRKGSIADKASKNKRTASIRLTQTPRTDYTFWYRKIHKREEKWQNNKEKYTAKREDERHNILKSRKLVYNDVLNRRTEYENDERAEYDRDKRERV